MRAHYLNCLNEMMMISHVRFEPVNIYADTRVQPVIRICHFDEHGQTVQDQFAIELNGIQMNTKRSHFDLPILPLARCVRLWVCVYVSTAK